MRRNCSHGACFGYGWICFRDGAACFASVVFSITLMISVSCNMEVNYTMLKVVNVKEDSAKCFFETECCPKCCKLR